MQDVGTETATVAVRCWRASRVAPGCWDDGCGSSPPFAARTCLPTAAAEYTGDVQNITRCPICHAPERPPPSGPSLPVGTVLALVGGLALVVAFWMPWFGTQVSGQGILLSGDVLGRVLSGTDDLRRFMPGSSGSPWEARGLRALVYFFPVCGALAAILALLTGWVRGRWLTLLLVAVGVVPLVALLIGMTRLPPGSSREIGLWLIGAGSVAIALGPVVNGLLARGATAARPDSPEQQPILR